MFCFALKKLQDKMIPKANSFHIAMSDNTLTPDLYNDYDMGLLTNLTPSPQLTALPLWKMWQQD